MRESHGHKRSYYINSGNAITNLIIPEDKHAITSKKHQENDIIEQNEDNDALI